MSVSIIARRVEEPPEEGGSDEGGGFAPWFCEHCEAGEFHLSEWRGYPVVVCVDCGKPQDGVTWAGTGDE